jgi:hypothetical protein
MSKLVCGCGAILSDVEVPSPNAGEVLWDVEEPPEPAADQIVSFIDSIRRGVREQWVEEFYSSKNLSGISDEAVIEDILRRHRASHRVYRCLTCGRIYIEEANGEWTPYTPEI